MAVPPLPRPLPSCLGPLSTFLDEAKTHPSGLPIFESVLRHRFHIISSMFFTDKATFALGRTMHETGTVITGLPALVFMNPSVLAQFLSTKVIATPNEILQRSLAARFYAPNVPQISYEDCAFTCLVALVETRSVSAPPVLTTLPICVRPADELTVHEIIVNDNYTEYKSNVEDLAHIIPDGHYINMNFHHVRVYTNPDLQTHILLLVSPDCSATSTLCESTCTADFNFFTSSFAYSAYPQTIFDLDIITTTPLADERKACISRLGFTIYTDFSHWTNHDCSTLPHCPQRFRNLLDADNFYVRFRPTIDVQYDIKRITRYVFPTPTVCPPSLTFTLLRSSNSSALPMWRLGGPPCSPGDVSFPAQLFVAYDGADPYLPFVPAPPAAAENNNDADPANVQPDEEFDGLPALEPIDMLVDLPYDDDLLNVQMKLTTNSPYPWESYFDE